MYHEHVTLIDSDVLYKVLLLRNLMEGQNTANDMLQGFLLIESWLHIVAHCTATVLSLCLWIDAKRHYASIEVR